MRTKKSNRSQMPLLSHLEEFRKRLVLCAIVFFIAVLACLSQAEWAADRLMEKASGFQFVYITPTELVLSYLRLSLIGGAVLSFPVILYHILMFIWPGLVRREKSACILTLIAGLLLFCVGVVFAFEIVIPLALVFFAGLNSGQLISAMVSIDSYLGFLCTTLVTFGIVFEMPVAVVLLTKIGLLTPELLRKNRKFAVLGIFIVAALITPPDVTSQLLVAIPMLALFEVSLALSRLMSWRKRKNTLFIEREQYGS